MLLTEKSGFLRLRVSESGSGTAWPADPGLVLTDWQLERAETGPDLIQRRAQFIAEHSRDSTSAGAKVRANAWVSMNGFPAPRIIDPEVELSGRPRSLLPAD